MKETKFHKMEKEISELKKELSDLRAQVLSLALARNAFVPVYPNPLPNHIPYCPPQFIGTENVQEDVHTFTVKC